jgi:acyl-CoA synthetase (AMP-forming)/AMP-acid ligase II/NAD(P)-dependent dehydrogenase (short-subunit alcohol dehydrogenase family)/acyl carrier protein
MFSSNASLATAALMALPGVEDGVVRGRINAAGGFELIAYVSAAAYTETQWRASLAEQLPVEAQPSAYVWISELPLTSAGEVDDEALSRIAVIDEDLTRAAERRLREVPNVTQVMALIEDAPAIAADLHLSDLHAAAGRPATSRPTAVDGVPVDGVSSSPAISHGPELMRRVPRNLAESLSDAVARRPKHGITYVSRAGAVCFQSYAELIAEADCISAGLHQLGVKPQDPVILQLPDNRDFIPAFWGCVLGGFVPVPIAPPPSYGQADAALEKLQNAWRLLNHPPIMMPAMAAVEDLAQVKAWSRTSRPRVVDLGTLRTSPPRGFYHHADPDAVALILFTSGSTGVPKGVQLSHRNVLARAAGTAQACEFTDQDRTLNWFPLEHVGGIVMFHLLDVHLAAQQMHVASEFVLEDPLRWLDLIEKHRATITWAPNFAFGLVGSRAEEIASRRWNLSTLRFVLNGGEAVVAATAHRFTRLLARHGLPATAMHPAWGMSETASGVTFNHDFKPGNPPDDASFVEVGCPIPGTSVRIVDPQDHIVDQGTVGRLQVRGEPVTRGYYANPEVNAESFSSDGWFNTGDLGVLANGRLTITGRSKDVIIVNGANFHSHEIEAVVESVAGVEPSFTAACAVTAAGSDTDRVCVFFHASRSEWRDVVGVVESIRESMIKSIGLRPDYVVPVEKHAIPKTAIGKIQRSELKLRFESGEFDSLVKRLDLEARNGRTIPNWFHEPVWVPRRRPTLALGGGRRNLVFADSSGLATAVCEALTALGDECIVVEAGEAFARVDDNRFCLDPTRSDDYAQLAAAVTDRWPAIDRVLHLWCYDQATEPMTAATLARAQYTGTYSLLFLLQSMPFLQTQGSPTSIVFVTARAQAVPGRDAVIPTHATASGFLKTLAVESTSAAVRHLDLDGNSAADDARNVLSELSIEVSRPDVAYCGGRRAEAYLRRIDWSAGEMDDSRIEKGGAYLVTGGLGGLGTQVAERLVREYDARVLLVGTTGLDEERRNGCPTDKKTEARLRNLHAIRAQANDPDGVVYRALDLGDFAALRSAVAEAEQKWCRPLSGVFHLAGVANVEHHVRTADRHWVATETVRQFEEMFRPKVYGTANLFALLEARPDTLFVAFSSVNALFGAATYSAYGAANSFLNAYCAGRRQSTHPNTYCLVWTMWDDIGGSEAAPEYTRESSRNLGYRVLPPHQGVVSMLAGLRRAPGELVIGLDDANRHLQKHVRGACRPRHRLVAYYATDMATPIVGRVPSAGALVDRFGLDAELTSLPLAEEAWQHGELPPSSSLLSAGTGRTARTEPRTDLEKRVARIWREVLSLPEIGVDERFFDLGGDSLLGMRLVNRIRDSFGVQLPLRLLLEKPTIAELSAALSGEPAAPVATAVTDAWRADAPVDVNALSDEQVDALLQAFSATTPQGQ